MTRTTEEVREIVEDLGYELLEEYMEENYRRVIIQDIEGYRFYTYLNNLMRGYIPPIAGENNPFVLTNISLWLEKENKSFVLCENNVYKGNRKKLFFQCLREDCQEIFDTTWTEIYNMGRKCPFCGGDRVGKHNNLACRRPDLAKEWDYEKNEKNPEEYTCGSDTKVSWICSECGHHWDASVYSRSNGTGCPKCSDLQKESTIANELKKYFKLNYNAIKEYHILKNTKTGYWLPYDIYIPYGENPELNGFYIEIHGEQHYKICHFHKMKAKKNNTNSEEEFAYQQWKDKLKKQFAKKNGTYIEVNILKVKTIEEAIGHIEEILRYFLGNTNA